MLLSLDQKKTLRNYYEDPNLLYSPILAMITYQVACVEIIITNEPLHRILSNHIDAYLKPLSHL